MWWMCVTFLLLPTTTQQGLMLVSRPAHLNGTALYPFFEERLGQHGQDVVERAEMASKCQCTWKCSITSNMTDVTAATTEGGEVMNSLAGNGGIIIVGGVPSTTGNSLALFMLPPSRFPVELSGNTLSVVGSALYSCGGGDDNKKCWHLETGTNDSSWDPFDIPWVLQLHSAVVVQDDIWFFSNSKLMILHTRNTVNKFREIDLGFSFSSEICAVVQGSHIFVIGVGERRDEIYVNKNRSEPEQWKRFSHLLQGRIGHGCLVYDAEIIVTAGWIADTGTRLSSVEAMSVVDGSVRRLGPLSGVRNSHKMAIIQGRPAVLGGHNGAEMATIETFDRENNSWDALGYSLSEPRYYFGLAQYRP